MCVCGWCFCVGVGVCVCECVGIKKMQHGEEKEKRLKDGQCLEWSESYLLSPE